LQLRFVNFMFKSEFAKPIPPRFVESETFE